MRRAAAILMGVSVTVVATLTPNRHDFGPTVVTTFAPYFSFQVTLPSGALATDSIDVSIGGQHPTDFKVSGGGGKKECTTPRPGGGNGIPGSCQVPVTFTPRALGPRTADLWVVDKQGRQVKATLVGTGIKPLCTNAVVFCNYAFMYTGTFGWRSILQGDYGSNTRSITVNIQGESATCDGAETEVSISIVGNQRHATTNTGRIYGDGLIGVELLQDSLGRPAYQVTVACPSPAWPAAMGRSREPAELGTSYEEKTYPVRIIFPPGSPPQYPGDTLVGNRNEPHPDTDPANNVSGSIVVTWKLTAR